MLLMARCAHSSSATPLTPSLEARALQAAVRACRRVFCEYQGQLVWKAVSSEEGRGEDTSNLTAAFEAEARKSFTVSYIYGMSHMGSDPNSSCAGLELVSLLVLAIFKHVCNNGTHIIRDCAKNHHQRQAVESELARALF